MNYKLILFLSFLLNAIISFTQSNPENEVANAVKINSVNKCTVYIDSSGLKTPYYELYYNESGLNTSRTMGLDVDLYEYNESSRITSWMFTLSGDSLWYLKHHYFYNEAGKLNKELHSNMHTNGEVQDSIIYIYQDTILTEKLYYKNDSLFYKSLITYQYTKLDKTIIHNSFEGNKLLETTIFKYNLQEKVISKTYEYQYNRPTFTILLKYDDKGREISNKSYSGKNDLMKDITTIFYQDNGLIERIVTPDFTLYYSYE
jgi:hypothetical protein